ncbi:MAG: hypothetical protein KGI33_03585 [Thaumarchaeota archaeon]|nr:hypothetical protein [Nitrososphaerota archaeon]
MLPERCSVRQNGRDCILPPEFVISVKSSDGEYMVGVTCDGHKKLFGERLGLLQREGSVPQGSIHFEQLKPVGTSCIKSDPDDLIQL